ncbi:MAG TPA: HEAT repeat domain-containing protein [Anaerolineales bacterium]|nr:HEAT repeat domain-containing protein [Anaerolineales bacterium]
MDKIRIDQLSFWIGFVAALIFGWLFRQARPAFQLLRQAIGERFGAVRQGLSVSAEQRYREDALKLFGEEHLTAPLFSLQEIAIPPMLLVPPPPVIPGEVLPPESITDIAVPYLPDYPEVGGQFQSDRISIPTAMSKGGNLLLMGKPGSGRTFALTLLATQAAQRHPDVGELGNLIPIYVHAGGLNLNKNEKPIDVLYDAFYERVSMILEASLKDFFSNVFESELALMLVDGLDELPKEDQKEVVVLLRNLQKKYPGNRYIVATSEDDLYSQEALNLHAYALAGWDEGQKQTYIKQWGQLWTEHIASQSWASGLPEIYDPVILNSWLGDDTQLDTPFFMALKTWTVYAGDQRGPGEIDAIEAYLRRMYSGIKNARPALENLAAQSILNQTPFLETRKARSYIAEFEELVTGELDPAVLEEDRSSEGAEELLDSISGSGGGAEVPSVLDDDELDALLDELDDLDLDPEPEQDAEPQPETGPAKSEGRPSGRMLLPTLNEAGLLVVHPNGRYGFIHPIFAGYLAGANLSSAESQRTLNQQKNWTGKHLAQLFLPVYKADMFPLIAEAQQQAEKDPIRSRLVKVSSWVKYAPKGSAWRNNFLRSLAATLQDENLPLTLRARLMSSLAFSGEGGIASLFKQMISSETYSVRWLGVLGCALLRNRTVVGQLGDLLYDPSIFVSRAACLALVTIGTEQALELVTAALLQANDQVRRAAAEALAQHPLEGHPVLKDGASVEDVQVRRAVVFGLARVREEWAEEILARLQTEDSQWVVRNAAIQTVEDMKLAKLSVPEALAPIHEVPWLIAFAGEKGMGLAPGQAGWDLLVDALREGNEERQLAAMYIYRRTPSEANVAVPVLKEIMSGPEGEIREAAYYTLWHLRAAGVNLETAS